MENTTPGTGERLLTLKQAAEWLRLDQRTLRRYLRRGELQGRLIGRRWRFRHDNLDSFYDNARSFWDFKGQNEHGD